jgi:hypothetical protein
MIIFEDRIKKFSRLSSKVLALQAMSNGPNVWPSWVKPFEGIKEQSKSLLLTVAP